MSCIKKHNKAKYLSLCALMIICIIAASCSNSSTEKRAGNTKDTSVSTQVQASATASALGNYIQEVSDIPHKRYQYTAHDINGLIYFIGGYNSQEGQPPVSETDIYDTKANIWRTGAPMPKGKGGHASCLINDKIYVFGGDIGYNWTSSCEVYDTKADKWSQLPAVPIDFKGGIGQMACSALDNKAYIFGGIGDSKAVWEFDTMKKVWNKKAAMSTGRVGATSSVYNGQIYVIGGSLQQFNRLCAQPLATVSVYSPNKDTWSQSSSFTIARAQCSSVLIGSSLFVIGGVNDKENNSGAVEEFSLATNKWSVKTPMPTQYVRVDEALKVNNTIYLLGEKIYKYTPN